MMQPQPHAALHLPAKPSLVDSPYTVHRTRPDNPRLAFIEDAGNDTYTYSSLPVSLRGAYHTFQSWDYVSPFANVSSRGDAPSWLGNTKLKTEVYDLHVTQSVPIIVAAQDDVQFVCITPNNITAGSRTPESRQPWTVAQKGSAIRLGGSLALAIGLMRATALMIMF
jgi:hypothetical protein